MIPMSEIHKRLAKTFSKECKPHNYSVILSTKPNSRIKYNEMKMSGSTEG